MRYNVSISLSKTAEERNVFPTEGLPRIIRKYAENISEVYGVPIEMATVPLLVACGTAIRKAVWLDTGKYKNFAQFYAMINTPSGTNKTVVLKRAFDPLQRIDSDNYKIYLNEVKTWEAKCVENRSMKPPKAEPPKPTYKQLLIDDLTPEGLIKALFNNEGSITILVDELSGWFSNWGRYNKSNEEQTYLSYFNNIDKTVNRVGSKAGEDVKRISEPNVSIIGGIQPGVLERTLNSDAMQENGFSSRVLYVSCEDLQCAYENDLFPDDQFTRNYDELIYGLTNLNCRVGLGLTTEANDLYKEFCNYIVDTINPIKNNEFLRSSLAKMKIHCLRLALVVHVINTVERNEVPENVGADAMQYAIDLCNYFIGNIPVRNKADLTKINSRHEGIIQKLKMGMSQIRIAELSGCSQQTVSQIKKKYKITN